MRHPRDRRRRRADPHVRRCIAPQAMGAGRESKRAGGRVGDVKRQKERKRARGRTSARSARPRPAGLCGRRYGHCANLSPLPLTLHPSPVSRVRLVLLLSSPLILICCCGWSVLSAHCAYLCLRSACSYLPPTVPPTRTASSPVPRTRTHTPYPPSRVSPPTSSPLSYPIMFCC